MHARPKWVQPESEADKARWEHLDKVHRILDGQHTPDVREEVRAMFSTEIAEELNIAPDISSNVLEDVATQRAINYDDAPMVDAGPDLDLSPIVTPSLWPQRATSEYYLNGFQEVLTAVDWPSEQELAGGARAEATYRLVLPNFVECDPHPLDPTQPGRVAEYRPRKFDSEGWCWTREVWDWRSATNPRFYIEKLKQGGTPDDVTEMLTGGTEYPYTDTSGLPIPRYVITHMAVGHRLWSWARSIRPAATTLRAAALWTQWGDGFLNAANPQRYTIDLHIEGGHTRSISGQQVEVVPIDRKSIAQFKSEKGQSGSVGTLAPAMNVRDGIDAIQTYEQRAAISMGLSSADFQVTSGQSGYAIVMSREGLRRAQKRVRPALQSADQKLLAYAARMANRYLSPSPGLPEDPREYRIEYHELPRSPMELKAEAEARSLRVASGLLSPIDALREENPGMSEADALATAAQIARDKMIVAELAQRVAPDESAVRDAAEEAGATLRPDTAPEREPQQRRDMPDDDGDDSPD